MSTKYSPKIVTDGLVLCLDAANSKSYVGSGTSWNDLSRNNNTGTLVNGPTYTSSFGGGIVFDGTNDYVAVSCAANTIRPYNSTTVFWINLPLYSGGQRCIMSYRGYGGGNLYIGKNSGGIFCYYNELNSSGYTVGTITNATNAMIAVTCDATNNLLNVYTNGSLVGSVVRTGWVTSYNTAISLGFDNGGTAEYMLGNMYNFMHYNRVLTASEILQNYNATKGRYNL